MDIFFANAIPGDVTPIKIYCNKIFNLPLRFKNDIGQVSTTWLK